MLCSFFCYAAGSGAEEGGRGGGLKRCIERQQRECKKVEGSSETSDRAYTFSEGMGSATPLWISGPRVILKEKNHKRWCVQWQKAQGGLALCPRLIENCVNCQVGLSCQCPRGRGYCSTKVEMHHRSRRELRSWGQDPHHRTTRLAFVHEPATSAMQPLSSDQLRVELLRPPECRPV